jgi:hypothetical protein
VNQTEEKPKASNRIISGCKLRGTSIDWKEREGAGRRQKRSRSTSTGSTSGERIPNLYLIWMNLELLHVVAVLRNEAAVIVAAFDRQEQEGLAEHILKFRLVMAS